MSRILARKMTGIHPDFKPGTAVRYEDAGPTFGLRGETGTVIKGWQTDTRKGWVTVNFGSTATAALVSPVFLTRV